MEYVLSIGIAFGLVWLPLSGCCQPPPPQAPMHQFGGYHNPQVQPQHPPSPGAVIQQSPGSTGLPPSQAPAGQPLPSPDAQHQSADGAEPMGPGSGVIEQP